MNAIPVGIKDALLAGGTNTSFHFYDWNETKITAAKLEVPKMAAAGARHVRILLSQNSIEDGTSGKLKEDRYQAVLAFGLLVKQRGMLPIFDVHNTGIAEPGSPDWTDNYMWGIAVPAVRTRHLSLLTEFARRLGQEDALRDFYILTSANEPIYDGGDYPAKSVWYNYQKQLIPAMRSACPDGVFTVVANDWNGIEATIYDLSRNMPFWDERMIIDCHFYEPMPLTHTDQGESPVYPGDIPTWRTNRWDASVIDGIIKPLADWRDKDARHPFVFFSEFGTNRHCDRDSRRLYTKDVVGAFRKYGFGYTIYTWFDNVWSIQDDPELFKILWTVPAVDPPVVPPADESPTRAEFDAMQQQIIALQNTVASLIEQVNQVMVLQAGLDVRIKSAGRVLVNETDTPV